jgi:hypothetical protein
MNTCEHQQRRLLLNRLIDQPVTRGLDFRSFARMRSNTPATLNPVLTLAVSISCLKALSVKRR